MLLKLLVIINTIIFSFLSAVHIYWVMGGQQGISAAIPEKYRADYFEKAGLGFKVATMIVAIGLFIFALISLSNGFSNFLSSNWTVTLTRIIGAIFLIRAIGDFNMVGMFKKKSNDIFAVRDSKLYVPLCLYLGISSILITFL